ncbi:MAG: outer membrane protein assembly factor BamA [Rhodospirillaceae bacterium]|nr:outer membrane protein assembly factor BamA [Rhodospirillaceae bacterium]
MLRTWALALVLAWGALAGGTAVAQQLDRIQAISVVGNQRIEDSTILSYLRVAPGDRFDPERINDSLKSLYDTGLFADIRIGRDGNALVVSVVENPIVNRLAFEGNKRIKDDALEAEVQLHPRTVYTRTKVQQDAARLLEVYRRSGRFAATVEPKVISLDQNRVDLVFEINEGPLTGVRKIVFIGNHAFSDADLREAIQTKQTRWWRILSTSDNYDPDRLTADRELLRRFYLKNGYADFRVNSAVAELTPDRTDFYITFTIDEGERYRFGNINVESRLPELDPEAVSEDVLTEEEDWYDAEEVESTIQALTDAVGSLGYAFVDVKPKLDRDPETHTIAVDYQIEEGPRVYVERINIRGNVRTLDRVIRRNVALVEGDAFNSAKIRRSRKDINNLNFFSDVNITNDPGSAPDQTVINVDVTEKSTGEVTLGAGYSSTDGVIGSVGVRERNLLGRGQDLSVRLAASSRTLDLDLSFTEPYFLNRDLSAGFDVFNSEREFPESGFNRNTTGFTLRSGFPVTENITQTWNYTLRQVEIEALVGASKVIIQEDGKRLESVIGQSLFYDRLDNRRDPSKGHYIRFQTDFAGIGGDVHYLRNKLEAAKYFPIWDETVFSVQAEAGYIFGLKDEDILTSDRFFLGSQTFRGFAVAGLGPRDLSVDNSLGGNLMYKGTMELAFPIGLPNELGIKGRLFGIVGTVTQIDDNDPAIIDTGSLRASVGAGVSWTSPFGPLRLDFGYAVLKEDFDETENFTFTFGTFF